MKLSKTEADRCVICNKQITIDSEYLNDKCLQTEYSEGFPICSWNCAITYEQIYLLLDVTNDRINCCKNPEHKKVTFEYIGGLLKERNGPKLEQLADHCITIMNNGNKTCRKVVWELNFLK